MMTFILTSIVISALSFAWLKLGARKDPHGHPWLTVSCMAVFLALPLLALLPKVQVSMPVQMMSADSPDRGAVSLWILLAAVWVFGTCLTMVSLLWRYSSLIKWVKSSDELTDVKWQKSLDEAVAKLDFQNRVMPELRSRSGLLSPVVAGLLRPVILLPKNAEYWSDQTRLMVILHELGHVQRRDLWSKMLAEVCCVMYWFNPIVWWMKAQLVMQCEYACDAHVIRSGIRARAYVNALCDVAENNETPVLPQGVLAMVGHASLKMRTHRLKVHRQPQGICLAVLAFSLTTLAAVSLSLVKPQTVSVEALPLEIDTEIRLSADPFPAN